MSSIRVNLFKESIDILFSRDWERSMAAEIEMDAKTPSHLRPNPLIDPTASREPPPPPPLSIPDELTQNLHHYQVRPSKRLISSYKRNPASLHKQYFVLAAPDGERSVFIVDQITFPVTGESVIGVRFENWLDPVEMQLPEFLSLLQDCYVTNV